MLFVVCKLKMVSRKGTVLFLLLLLVNCVTLNLSFNLSGPKFFHLQNKVLLQNCFYNLWEATWLLCSWSYQATGRLQAKRLRKRQSKRSWTSLNDYKASGVGKCELGSGGYGIAHFRTQESPEHLDVCFGPASPKLSYEPKDLFSVKHCAISWKVVRSRRCPSTGAWKQAGGSHSPTSARISLGFMALMSLEDTVSQHSGPWEPQQQRGGWGGGWGVGSHCPERWAVGGLTTHLGSNSRYSRCERGCREVPSGSAGPAQTDGPEQPTRQLIDPCGSCSRLFVSTCENQPSDRRLEQRLRFCDSRGCAGLVDTAHDCDFTSVVLI